MAGLFYRYGLIVEGRALIRAVDQSDVSKFSYLDAFCTAGIVCPKSQTALDRLTRVAPRTCRYRNLRWTPPHHDRRT